MNIYLYYIFEIGLLALVIVAIVVAVREALTEPEGANESPEN